VQKLDSAATASVRDAVSDMRDSLFAIAKDANRLNHRQTDLHSFIQGANYNLSEAERELTALTSAPVPTGAG
jgi:hypothetical protein